jgi:hypothetical protein
MSFVNGLPESKLLTTKKQNHTVETEAHVAEEETLPLLTCKKPFLEHRLESCAA